MRSTFFVLAIFALCLVSASSVAAQGPFDESDPAAALEQILGLEASACDGEQGAAFGLCTAYCEAMDCDSGAPHASARACTRVADRYQQITGTVPPCDCPCVGQIDDWFEAVSGDFGYSSCVDSSAFGEFVVVFTDNGLAAAAQAVPEVGVCYCGFGFGTGNFLNISVDEARRCNDLIRDTVANNGVECTEL